MHKIKGYPIKVVARRTGLSPHVIRVWERRYQAVTPVRTETNRRLYSETEIERLRLLSAATSAGHSIGQIAGLADAELRELITRDEVAEGLSRRTEGLADEGPAAAEFVRLAMNAIEELDVFALQDVLARAEVGLSVPALLVDFIVPMMDEIGCQWREGSVRVAGEHMASACVRSFLGNLRRAYTPAETAPSFIAVTPPGQNHEIGALLAAIVAEIEGWRVTYLGPNLPVEEIAGAAHKLEARAVGVSLVHPPDDARLARDMIKLGHSLPADCTLVVGGRSVKGYEAPLAESGARVVYELRALREVLEQIQLRIAAARG